MSEYTLGELDAETQVKITNELTEILEKYDCEMQVSSTIHILKREPKLVVSPYDSNTGKETDTTTEA